ncbi:MAG: amidohydrolase family protein [Thermodesulfovibrionales bacterium]|nr:amidohydrolase family protein [Thermodesulfovibrionales bacterium]
MHRQKRRSKGMTRRDFIKTTALVGVSIGSGLLQSCSDSSNGQTQKTFFTNGTIYIDAEKKVKGIAIKDGRVIAHNPVIAKSSDNNVVDLNGAVVYPGFHDSHNHLMEAAVGYGGINLAGIKDSVGIAQKVKQKAAETPDGKPIIGVGFHLDDYDSWSLNDLARIDDASEDHPVFLMDDLGHNAIINSVLIKLAGLTPSTPVPMAGKVVIQDGKLTGMLRESAMILAGDKILSLFTDDEVLDATKKFCDLWASIGYTSINDMMGTPMGRFMRPQIFKKLESQGLLSLRVNYTHTIFSLDDIEGATEYVGKDTEMVRFIGCKLFVDGAFGAGQAWTSWKNLQGNNGVYYVYTDDSFGKQYNINRIVERADELRLNMHYHVQGDMAIEAVLNAMTNVRSKKGRLSSVHTLVHLGFPRQDQIDRMKEFGSNIAVTMQPAFAVIEEDASRYYGEMMKNAYPISKVINAGITTGISTDFSVSPLSLAPALVVLKYSSQLNNNPVTMKQLIQGMTVGSASTTAYKDTGTLEIGNCADMVVFDKDIYDVPADKLSDTSSIKLLSTWVGGKKVF